MTPRSRANGVKVRLLMAALLAAAGGLGAAVAAGAHDNRLTSTGPSGSGTGTSVTSTTTTGAGGGSGHRRIPRSQRTHPHVSPASGGPSSSFELSFKLRQAPGHQGAMATDYRVEVAPHHGAANGCWPPQPARVSSGKAGSIVTLALGPPPGGWCLGRYRVTVYLERGPYCPPPQNGQPQPCPEFATQEMVTGRIRFTIQ